MSTPPLFTNPAAGVPEWTVDTRLLLVHYNDAPQMSFAFEGPINRPSDIRASTPLYVGPVISEIELALLEQAARRLLRETLFGEAFPQPRARRVERRVTLMLAWPPPPQPRPPV